MVISINVQSNFFVLPAGASLKLIMENIMTRLEKTDFLSLIILLANALSVDER